MPDSLLTPSRIMQVHCFATYQTDDAYIILMQLLFYVPSVLRHILLEILFLKQFRKVSEIFRLNKYSESGITRREETEF